jgi:hypothetical protein
MTSADRRIAEWLFLLTFAVSAYFYGGAGWSQNATFDLTRAMVERHTLAIDAYASNTGDVSLANGHVYANKAPALAVLAVVPYSLIHAVLGAPQNAVALAISSYLCTLFTVGILAALIPALLYRELRRRGVDSLWSAAVALTIAFATELLPYSTVLMFTLPSGALLLLGYTARRGEVGGFATALAVAMNYLCAPALLLFALKPSAQKGRFAAGAIPPLVALAVYQRLCFGSFFATSIAREHSRFLTKGAAYGVFGTPSVEALFGITFSPYRGLFFFAPVLLLALIPLIRERAVLALSLVFFAANVSFNGWEGGFGIGARYLVPLIPLWGLALANARPRALVIAAAVLSFAINFTAVAVDPQPSATIPRPLTQYLVPLLVHGRFSPDVPITKPWSAATFTGHTSVNRLAHDEAVVFTRHAPGSAAAEWSSFNLGEPLFGAGDARSLIPVGVLLAAGCAAILETSRRLRRASAATPTR